MPARLARTLAIVALAAFRAQAQAQTPLELAERLYERAAMAEQVRPIPGQFAEGLEEYRGKIPDPVIADLDEAAKKIFAEEALRGEIVAAIAEKMKPEDMVRTLDWLDGLVGRRVTRAEAGSASSVNQQNVQAYAESRKKKAPNPKRDRAIADLIRATGAVELGASLIEAITLGIAVGTDATQPVEKRIGLPGLRARQRAAMPPEKVREAMGATLPPMYAYIYREISDADLAAYVRFSASPLGQRYNEAASVALTGALARASVRVGEMLPAAQEKKEI
jgi:hypothetical protein